MKLASLLFATAASKPSWLAFGSDGVWTCLGTVMVVAGAVLYLTTRLILLTTGILNEKEKSE